MLSSGADLLATQPSNPYAANTVRLSSLDLMNAEGQAMLDKKDSELTANAATIADAERILGQLQRQIEAKPLELASLTSGEEPESSDQLAVQRELEALDQKHRNEI